MEFNATFIVSAISFIAFTLIMNWIFYKPIEKIVSERQQFVEQNYKEAAWAKEQVTSLINDKVQKLEATKTDAKKIILDKSEETKKQKTQMAQDAQQQSATEVESTKQELHKSKEEAQTVLASEVDNLAKEISSKILKG